MIERDIIERDDRKNMTERGEIDREGCRKRYT